MAKQIILAAHFPGVDNTTVWSEPQSGSQIDLASFAHLARPPNVDTAADPITTGCTRQYDDRLATARTWRGDRPVEGSKHPRAGH